MRDNQFSTCHLFTLTAGLAVCLALSTGQSLGTLAAFVGAGSLAGFVTYWNGKRITEVVLSVFAALALVGISMALTARL